jgi:hypothetical protein
MGTLLVVGVEDIGRPAIRAVTEVSDVNREASDVILRKVAIAFDEKRCNGEVPVGGIANRNQGPQCAMATLMIPATSM